MGRGGATGSIHRCGLRGKRASGGGPHLDRGVMGWGGWGPQALATSGLPNLHLLEFLWGLREALHCVTTGDLDGGIQMLSDIDRARYLEAQRQRRPRLREIRDASGCGLRASGSPAWGLVNTPVTG